ncbi:MAG: hypothetical protein ACRCZP_09525, partial [Phycicoccus sp.]
EDVAVLRVPPRMPRPFSGSETLLVRPDHLVGLASDRPVDAARVHAALGRPVDSPSVAWAR